MLEAWGRTVFRVRWPLLAASTLLLAVSGWLVVQGGDLRDPDSLNSSESGRASALLNRERNSAPQPSGTPVGTTFLILFESDTLQVTDPAFKDAVTAALAPPRADPRVQTIRTYYDAPAQSASLLSRDGRRTAVSV